MFNKFYFKFFLFCVILLLCALIIDTKRRTLNLPVYLKSDISLSESYLDENEYLIYVADMNDMIFPLNIITMEKNEFKMNHYDTIINNGLDKKIYMTYSLLTNYSNYLPIGVKTYIPKSSKLESYELNENRLILNVSKAFLNYDKKYEEEILKIITYTFSSITDVKEIKLLCENKEISFYHIYDDTLKKDDFLLNVFFNTGDINRSTPYCVYYFTDINNNYYLVPTTIYDFQDDLPHFDKINILITKTFNIPLITLIEPSNIDEISSNSVFQENLLYYQYYLTCFENNINDKNYAVDIKNINFYKIELD